MKWSFKLWIKKKVQNVRICRTLPQSKPFNSSFKNPWWDPQVQTGVQHFSQRLAVKRKSLTAHRERREKCFLVFLLGPPEVKLFVWRVFNGIYPFGRDAAAKPWREGEKGGVGNVSRLRGLDVSVRILTAAQISPVTFLLRCKTCFNLTQLAPQDLFQKHWIAPVLLIGVPFPHWIHQHAPQQTAWGIKGNASARVLSGQSNLTCSSLISGRETSALLPKQDRTRFFLTQVAKILESFLNSLHRIDIRFHQMSVLLVIICWNLFPNNSSIFLFVPELSCSDSLCCRTVLCVYRILHFSCCIMKKRPLTLQHHLMH